MINLLPPELKDSYRYARRNSRVTHVITGLCFGIVGVVVLAGAGFFYLHISANGYKTHATEVQARLKEQKQAEVSKQVQEMSGRLKLADQVLSKEVLFSELLKQLAVVTPSKVALRNVDITEYGGGINISAEAASYEAASQLQVNLADPNNKIFANADILNITCNSQSTGRYPCNISIRALFREDNPFLFVNNEGVAQ